MNKSSTINLILFSQKLSNSHSIYRLQFLLEYFVFILQSSYKNIWINNQISDDLILDHCNSLGKLTSRNTFRKIVLVQINCWDHFGLTIASQRILKHQSHQRVSIRNVSLLFSFRIGLKGNDNLLQIM